MISTQSLGGRTARWLVAGLLLACLSPGIAPAEEPATAPVVPLDKLFELPTGFEARKADRRGGVGETEWRARFSEARSRLERSEAALAASKAQLAEQAESSNSWSVAPPMGGLTQNPTEGPLDYELSQRIKRDKREVDDAKKGLLDLEVEANLANVPAAWRQ